MAGHWKLGWGLLGAVLLGCGSYQPTATASYVPAPESFFITQYVHPRYHPQPALPDNANCGPTSLDMAIKAFGKVPRRLASDPEELIESVRYAMTGKRDPLSWTYPSQFAAAARAYGLDSEVVRSGVEGIRAELQMPGRMVVANVNPSPAYVDQLAEPFDGGHFTLVTGFDGRRFQLNDPMAPGPITVSKEQLATALETPLGPGIPPFDGGIAVWRAH